MQSSKVTRSRAILLAIILMNCAAVAHADDVDSRITIGNSIAIAPAWFDPADIPGIVTPFLVIYALHDSVLKAMPAGPFTPSLAERSSATEDGMSYEFVLRAGAKFHNGDQVTAEDVKFSFERYRGTGQADMKRRIRSVDIADGNHIRFNLTDPWLDFLTFYVSATGAGWVVPKKYVERVGDEGYKKAPIGAGPYKFVSFTPGVELVLEAFDQYWRKTPDVKRLVFRSIPEESTRFAALKRGEVDMAYGFGGELAREVQQTPGLTLKGFPVSVGVWLYFPEQWDPKSPWHDERVRRAASLAIDRKTMNEALRLGFSHLTGSIFPENFGHYWQPPAPEYDPGKAKQLLADAGYPNGFDAGDYYCDASIADIGEAVVNDLQEAGIRARLRPLERAAFFKGYAEKKFKNIIQGWSGAFGNVATRLQAFAVEGGTYAYGSYPDLDGLYRRQATEIDQNRRTAILAEIQRMVHERAMFAPIWQLAAVNAVGPRVAESGFGLIPGFPISAPYEDMTLKGR
jgi:peptide/nickel transport system substrate-binding protein